MNEMRTYTDKNRMSYYNPFREFDSLRKSFWNDAFDIFSGGYGFRTDIRDTGDAFVLLADLPGVEKKDIHIDIEGERLTVRAERRSECDEKEGTDRYVHCERAYGSYSRSFDISSVRTDEIKAEYKDGVLRLTMPKRSRGSGETRRLEIE